MAASTSFHRNVLLLTQVVPTSVNFKKHFCEGMFDKPNTAGFIHLSQYLLMIYDEERFRKLFQWPVVSKKMEVKYRNDVKEYLSIIANENPDVDFPPILASYLLSAHGRKFTDIMWKLSIVVLRTYIKRNCNQNIFYAPRPGPTDELIKSTLQRINEDSISSIMSYRRNIKNMREMFQTAIEEEEETLANIKHEFFENKQYLLHLVSKAPVDSKIKERLTNVEDTEIIESWRKHILEYVTYIKKKHMTLKNVETLSNRIINMILNRKSATTVLDTELLTKVHSSSISVLPLSENVQSLHHNLYVNNKLMLCNFIQLFNLLLYQIYQYLRKNELKDLSSCFLQIEASLEDMRLAIKWFQNQRTSITSASNNIKFDLHQKTMNQTYQESISPMKNFSLLPSPIIQINTNCSNEGNDLLKRVELTPVEGVHKSLFSRHKQQHGNNNISALQLRKNLLVSRINFDDTISWNSSDKISQPSICISKISSSPAARTGKYSRLFLSHTRKAAERGKSLKSCSYHLSTPHSSIVNSTVIVNAAGEVHNASQFSLGNTNEAEEGSTINTKNNKSNDIKDGTKGRRSISDLVQRYKRVLEISNQTSPYTEK